jgi:hypothetical protein
VIAALFVQTGGCYFGLPDVDPWDEARDARLYAGPHPGVAHPPCARWCRLAHLVESRGGAAVGDDGGCFASALASIRRWGGVLEHPAWSFAWRAHGLIAPPAFGWERSILDGGWVCEVFQSAYGHRANKATWLYYVGDVPPVPLNWSRREGTHLVTNARYGQRWRPEMSKKQRAATPPAFRDVLLSIARGARRTEAA